MTFGGWGLTNPAALWFGSLAFVIIAIHILKPRRVRRTVASILHWAAVESPVTSARPWQRLKPSRLLAAQVLAALLLALALAGPVRLTEEPLAQHTIFIVDASASMRAVDGDGDGGDDGGDGADRLAAAADRVRSLRDRVPAGGEVSLIVAGDEARAVVSRSRDRGRFEDAIGAIEPGHGTADFAGAFTLAAGLDTGESSTSVVFVSDGGVPLDDLLVAPVGIGYEPVGATDANRGVSQLSVEPTSDGLVARATVRHFGGPAATDELHIVVDGEVVDRRSVSSEPGGVINVGVPVPPGERIEATLEPDPEVADGYPHDNRFFATVSTRPEITALVVGGGNPFLEAALDVIPGLTVLSEPAFPAGVDLDGFIGDEVDVVIADRVTIPADLDRPVWAIAPPSGFAGVERAAGAEATVDRPALTLIRGDSPLTAGLDLSEVLFARAQRVTAPSTAEVILGAESAPLLISVRRPAGGDVVYQSFAVDETNLPLLVAFPLLTERILADLGRAATPPAKLPVGTRLPIDPRLEAEIVDPAGTAHTVGPGASAPVAASVGFWSIAQPGAVPVTVAVNPASAESDIAPVADLSFGPVVDAETGSAGPAFQGEVPLRRWVLAALLAVVVVEWMLARRRVGVGPRQWRFAQALRVAVAAALVLGLLGLAVNRPADRRAAVFLIDRSDSVRLGGTDEAVGFVIDALDAKAEADGAGVVAFGRNARLENVVSGRPAFDGLTVDVDQGGTDLAAALRLGAAALPGDARNRIVVLSDGRTTAGDAEVEARRLAEAGIPVDVVVLDPRQGFDLAVAGIRSPSVAQEGERIAVDAEIVAPRATTAAVTFRRGAEVLERRSVELTAGSNTIRFEDTAPGTTDGSGGGVLRYRVEVDGGSVDSVSANDGGFTAVRVAGPERVLVVDGGRDPGAATADLVPGLRAAGLPVDEVTVDRIPAFDELTSYSSIVLVNVSRGILSDGQVENLTRAVRDLGRGLVVIGGPRTYGPGGYLGTDLEQLLPVTSEVTDPLRRQTVAEVLAVDISGSMAFDGRVDKLGLARAALVKAVDNLAPTDQMGVITMDGADRWAMDLQPDPSDEAIDDALARMQPGGGTFLGTGLLTSAEALRDADTALKHIIMFSDGFTDPGELARLETQAADLAAEGITVSIVATGDGTPFELEKVAAAGGGRFYPGTDLSAIPDLIVQEVVLASRSFINEGRYLPTVTSNSRPVRGFDESPAVLGYVATTAKSTARVDLRVGPDGDPLMASWQVGLGRVTSWTSDAGERWTAPWNGWERAPDFWAGVVKETFPRAGGGGGVSTTIDGDRLIVRVEGSEAWPDDATAAARISRPGGEAEEVSLERIDGTTFGVAVPVDDAGVYAVGATVSTAGSIGWSGVGLATRSYPAEYAPLPVDVDGLARLATITGGRVDIVPPASFSPDGTVPGTQRYDVATWLLWFALLAWPLAVALARWTWPRGALAVGPRRAVTTVRQLQSRLPRIDRPAVSARPDDTAGEQPTFVADEVAERLMSGGPPTGPPRAGDRPPEASTGRTGGSTVNELLAGKRKRRDPG